MIRTRASTTGDDVERWRIGSAMLVLGMVIGGCGGGDGTAQPSDAPTTAAAPVTDAPEPTEPPATEGATEGATGAPADGELPAFMSEFDRVCTTQVGFPGAAEYDPAGTSPHPTVVLEEFDDEGNFIESSRTFPDGWTVEQDMNFEDNGELADVQLVACSEQVEARPTGQQCDLEMDDGTTRTLELVDGTFELTVYAATSGEEVGSATLAATSDDCPTFVFIDEDDTQYFNTPKDDDYISALRPMIAPG